jgi:hypothetical protein
MAAVYALVVEFARRLNNVDNIPQQDSAERAFNKQRIRFRHSRWMQRAVRAIAKCRPQVGGFPHAVPGRRAPFPPTVRKSHPALELLFWP